MVHGPQPPTPPPALQCRLHGTRSAEASALHIALGDRLALDVARVDCEPSANSMTAAGSAAAGAGVAGANGSAAGAQGNGGKGGKGIPGEGKEQGGGSAGGASGQGGVNGAGNGGGKGGSGEGESDSMVSHFQSSAAVGGQSGGGGGAGGGGGSTAGQGPQGQVHGPQLMSRSFVCQAAYGFLGDVMSLSEGLRFMGPKR